MRGNLKPVIVASLLAAWNACFAAGGSPGHVVREDIEWCRTWVPGVNQTDKPHVLLIGDSITEAYAGAVEQHLAGAAYVARLTTSKSLGDPAFLQEVDLILRNVRFQVIHFNNGMHGSGYTESEYRRDFPKLLKLLRSGAPGAQLICATTTPKRAANHLDQFDAFNERIKVRNEVARTFAARDHIAIDDLFALVEDHPEFYRDDGTHFKENGVKAEALQVAGGIESALKSAAK